MEEDLKQDNRKPPRGRTFLEKITDIQSGTDRQGTIQYISDNITLRGHNIWMLVCSTLLACLGLDLNSSAVLIGAMLISPLMNPILGAGLSVGTNDREMLMRTLRNLAIATFFSVGASALYFALTPFGEPTNEIISRTQPTLLDVMVAFFGGVAGIVSNSRDEKTNAIPGVAIATALMPPVCVAGFGIASLDWSIFLGAFYLYFINAVFISLATYLIVRFLHFPFKQYADVATRRRTRVYMILFAGLSILPSVYFLYNVYQELKTKRQIETLLVKSFEAHGNEVIKLEIMDKDSFHTINLLFAGKEMPQAVKKAYEDTLHNNGLEDYRLNIMRLNVSKDEIARTSSEVTREQLRIFELEHLSKRLQPDTVVVTPPVDRVQEFREVLAAFPDVERLGMGQIAYLRGDTARVWMDTLTTVTLQMRDGTADIQGSKEELRLYNFLKVKLKKDTLQIIYRPE